VHRGTRDAQTEGASAAIGKAAPPVASEPEAADFAILWDLAFDEIGLSGDAAFLVKGDKRHYPAYAPVVSPRELLRQYRRARRRVGRTDLERKWVLAAMHRESRRDGAAEHLGGPVVGSVW
jgi:hypothetical protein